MSNKLFPEQFIEDSLVEKKTPKDYIFKMLSFLPYFIISIILSLICAVSIIKYTDPLYTSSARLLIKNNSDKKPSFTNQGGGDLIETALFSNSQINLENEIMAIKSTGIIKKVVDSFHFNYEYYNEGIFRNSLLFENLPFNFESLKWKDSNNKFQIYISELSGSGGVIQTSKTSNDKKYFKWNTIISYQGNLFKLNYNYSRTSNQQYYFYYKPSTSTANELLANLNIYPNNSKATILQIDLKGANLYKISAIINAIIDEYSKQSLSEKNTIIDNTIKFINKRLDIVTNELMKVENDLISFKQNNKNFDVSGKTTELVSKKRDLEHELTLISNQEHSIQQLLLQINSTKPYQLLNLDKDISNDVITNLISQYNTLLLKKQKDKSNVGKNNNLFVELNNQIDITYNSILVSLDDFKKKVTFRKNELKLKLTDLEKILFQFPEIENQFIGIQRQQGIKQGLYLYLLQKREETAITSSSHSSNYQQLELANGSIISPIPSKIYTYALIFAILLPIGLILAFDYFNDKVQNRNDIKQKTKIPIISDISHTNNSLAHLIVADNSRSIISEQFRNLRTNLNFLLQDNKTILITSSMSGEGKSFIALNLAAVLAISSKKVALLEFDLRKPRILKNIGIPKKNIGLSNYLAKQIDTIDNLYYTLENYNSLHIYGSGPIPPNPAELMSGERIASLFEYLKANYDYIIVDTAPVGLVSDGFNIMNFIDNSIYVIRQRTSLKSQLKFLEDTHRNKQIKNPGIVFNDVKVGHRHSYYGHNYGYGYGYGFGYGYGYGYFDKKKENGGYFDYEKKQSIFTMITKKFKSKNV